MRFAALVTLVALAGAAAATPAFVGPHEMAGTLVQGEVDSSREGALDFPCTDALRPGVAVVASIQPSSPTDAVTVTVEFVDGARTVVLSALAPAATLAGTARDGCLPPTTLVGASVATVVAYEVREAAHPCALPLCASVA